MNIFNENEEATAFTLGLLVGAILASLIVVFIICDGETSEPTIVCRDGKLFEETREGNITIFESSYRDCEETK